MSDGTINLREKDEKPEFHIDRVEHEKIEPGDVDELKLTDKIKLRFDKFVELIATHAYDDILEKHRDQDVIISSNLLTDLANSHEEKSEKKVPIVFVVGIVLGVVLTWLLLRA